MNAEKEQLGTDNTFETVERFIRRLRTLELIIDSKSDNLIYSKENQFGLYETGSLADFLANSITAYESNRYNTRKRFDSAEWCLIWINKAYTNNVVKEGGGLINKLKEYSEKNAELLKENNELKKGLQEIKSELIEAKEKIKEYEDSLPHFTSDVT